MNKEDCDVDMLSPSECDSLSPGIFSDSEWNGFFYDSYSEHFYSLTQSAIKAPVAQPQTVPTPFLESKRPTGQRAILTDLLNDQDVGKPELAPGLQSLDTETILSSPSLIASHREYRRFRKYDLIRYKLEASPPLFSSIASAKVRFKPSVSVHIFRKNSVLHHCARELRGCKKPILKWRSLPDMNRHVPQFSFERFTSNGELSTILTEAHLKSVTSEPLADECLNDIVNLGIMQMKYSVHNIIVSLEGVSSIGKALVGVMNRLQAAIARTAVLEEGDPLGSPWGYAQSVRVLSSDCQNLRSDIELLKEVVLTNEGLLSQHSRNIATDVEDSFSVFGQIKALVTAIFQRERKSTHFDCFSFSSCTQYSKYTQFLSDQSTESLFNSLFLDLKKMKADLKVLEAICQSLLSHNRMALDNALKLGVT